MRFAILVPSRIWSEVAPVRRCDVIDGRWVYRVPKTGAKQVLPLPPMVLDLLEQCPDLGPFYFGSAAIMRHLKLNSSNAWTHVSLSCHGFTTTCVEHS